MPKPQPKKHFQIQRLFGLAKDKAALARQDTKEYLEDLLGNLTRGRIDRLSSMSFDDANNMIAALGGEPFRSYGHSRRNENYRKQQAGIKSVETVSHVEFIRKQAEKRGMSEEGITKLAERMNLPWPPRTTEQGNKLAEALKAMNGRDEKAAAVQSSKFKVQSQQQPKFRRVA